MPHCARVDRFVDATGMPVQPRYLPAWYAQAARVGWTNEVRYATREEAERIAGAMAAVVDQDGARPVMRVEEADCIVNRRR